MDYITVKSQAELDAVPVDTDKTIRIEFGTTECPAVVSKHYRNFVNACGNSTVKAYNNSLVEAQDSSYVEAYNNSHVVAWGTSTVIAYNNSFVEAWGSYVEAYDSSTVMALRRSTVKAYGRSYVEAWDSSCVEAWDSSCVEAWGSSTVKAYDSSSVAARGNSIVEAQDRSSVEAWGNVQICKDKTFRGEIKTHANARVVVMPESVDEFVGFYDITSDESAAVLYKAVHKIDKDGTIRFLSNYDKAFEYKIGEKICSYGFDMNSKILCSQGIHAAHLNWALKFGAEWNDLAILELKVNLSDIVIPDDSDGKVRVPEALVVREVPLEECGIYGKILARRRKNSEMRNSN